jgi:hypothetical protein
MRDASSPVHGPIIVGPDLGSARVAMGSAACNEVIAPSAGTQGSTNNLRITDAIVNITD